MHLTTKGLKTIWIKSVFLILGLQSCSLDKLNTNSNPPAEVLPNKNPTLLFKSSFGTGVTLDAITNYSDEGAWQKVIGTDQDSGFSWPIEGLNSTFTGIQMITKDPVTSLTVSNYAENNIQTIPGPNGDNVNVLYQTIKIKDPVGVWGAQSPLIIHRPWTVGDVTELYISYWYKNSAISLSQLDNTVSGADTIVQFQFKTGGYGDTWRGDYRISTVIKKDHTGNLYWQAHGDNNANGPDPFESYWDEENHTVSVPIDTWYKVEIYWYRSAGDSGLFWAAINGENIINHSGPNMGKHNLPINRIMIDSLYTGGHGPVESNFTGLEIWNGFPCGSKISCY